MSSSLLCVNLTRCAAQIIAINIDDPLAAQLNDIDDVDRLMPGAISAVRTYFRQVRDCVLLLLFQGRDSDSLPISWLIVSESKFPCYV